MITVAWLLGRSAAPALAATKTSRATPFDTDNDGTVDIDEAKKAAGELFDKLDTDKDGTLDVKELKGRLTQQEFTAADPDDDGTLSKDEYLAVVKSDLRLLIQTTMAGKGLSSRRQPAGLLASFCPRTVIGTEYPEPVFRLETQTEKL